MERPEPPTPPAKPVESLPSTIVVYGLPIVDTQQDGKGSKAERLVKALRGARFFGQPQIGEPVNVFMPMADTDRKSPEGEVIQESCG